MKNKPSSIKNSKVPTFIKGITQKLLLATITGFLTALPTHAAEKIYITYQSLQLSLRVESLAEYAETGKINADLAFYLRFVPEKDQIEFRKVLTERAQIDPVLLSRLLNTAIGEDILRRLGRVLNIPWGLEGKYAIRGALVQAAFEPEGLTLLGFLQKFPTNLQINVDRSFKVADAIDLAIRSTLVMIDKMSKLTAQEAESQTKVNFAQLPDITQPGKYGVVQETIRVTDSKRNRTFRLLIYKPQTWKNGKTPVIVFSHGLASRPEDFDNGAKQLASYGYLVALPQHIGSDSEQAANLIAGYARQVFELNEFIDRPLDISFVLDYLEKQNESVYQGRLNLKEVGVAGHSFGGYTALAVAGATIDFDYLAKECDLTVPRLNTSLLLQCRALDLPRKEYNFRDERVTAVIAANPVNYSIFGPRGLGKISIPIFMLAGTDDPAAPAIFEQFSSFPWFNSQDKYLGLVEGQAHVDFSKLDPGVKQTVNSLNVFTLATPQLLHKYNRALITSFFNVYVDKDENYRPYIDNIADYSQYLSQGQEFKIFIVSGKSSPAIKKTLTELGINQ